MSTIPPNSIASVIQSQGAQNRAADVQKKEQADEADRTGKTEFSKKLQGVIENEDRDSQVYSDAEGTGSQGRSSADEHPEKDESDQEESGAGGGLDVQA